MLDLLIRTAENVIVVVCAPRLVNAPGGRPGPTAPTGPQRARNSTVPT